MYGLYYLWSDSAYATVYWVLVVTHLVFTGFMVLENVYALVEASTGFYDAERHWGITVDGLNSHFVTAAWVAIYLTVFISPYWIR
jgi:cytochrome c oxidase subunit 3